MTDRDKHKENQASSQHQGALALPWPSAPPKSDGCIDHEYREEDGAKLTQESPRTGHTDCHRGGLSVKHPHMTQAGDVAVVQVRPDRKVNDQSKHTGGGTLTRQARPAPSGSKLAQIQPKR